jgi:hypothetical protein
VAERIAFASVLAYRRPFARFVFRRVAVDCLRLSVALQDAAQPGRNSLADTLGGPPRAAVSADNGPPPYLALSSSAVSVPSAVSSSFTGAVRTSLQLPDLRRPYAWTVGQVKETANAIGAPHRTGGTRRYLSAVQ